MLVKKSFDAGREDANPHFTRGFNKCDRTKVVEGHVVLFLRDRTEESPFPSWRSLSMGPEVYKVVI